MLKNLATKIDPADPVVRIYRMLYNPEMYWIAYRNLHPDRQTAGADETCMDSEMAGRIEGIIGFMRRQKYRPVSRTKIYDTHRVSEELEQRRDREVSDRLVEEALRVILTGVYEPVFRARAEKFQLGRLEDMPDSGWLVKGVISPRLDRFDRHLLCDILRQRIHDEKVISLLWGFLKAG